KRAASFSMESGAGARQRQILTRKGGPHQRRGARQVVSAQVRYVADAQLRRAEKRTIASGFFFTPLVCERAGPLTAKSYPSHPAPGKEFVPCQPLGVHFSEFYSIGCGRLAGDAALHHQKRRLLLQKPTSRNCDVLHA